MDDYHALASSISPSAVSRYLRAQGWVLIDGREGLLEEWAAPENVGSESESEIHLLPVNQEYRDFRRRFVEFLAAVAAYYQIDAHELSHRLRLGAADVLLFRVCHDDGVDDAVGIDEANDVLSAMHRMIAMSARYTASPNKAFTGRVPPRAKEYLAQYVQLGHTRPGSFVFPFISGPRDFHDARTLFARRVMENLAVGLDRVRGLPASPNVALDEFGPLVVALADGLPKLARSPAFSSIEFSFVWAAGREPSSEVPASPVALQLPEIREIAVATVRVKQYLQDRKASDYRLAASRGPVATPAPRVPALPEFPSVVDVEISGEIIALNIDDRRDSDWGSRYSIVIRADVQNLIVDVEMPVGEAEFAVATQARNLGEEVTAVGTLVRTMGGFTMRGQLTSSGQQQSR
ncbi:hypothetical protein [Streptomyces sp. enrichment culture]|uniref:hypothetical protein n=1 Tax=Streptomyces sp. enrichment culture TaxID=1795815 RepID=UPI003F5507E1